MKKVPCSGCVEYWSELTMFAPASNRKPDTAATMPGPSGQPINSLAVCCAPRARCASSSGISAWRPPAASSAGSGAGLLLPLVIVGVDLGEAFPFVGQLVLGEDRIDRTRLDAGVA